MKTLILSSIFSMTLLLLSCGSSGHQGMNTGDSKKLDITPDKLDIKLDPVCQMSMEKFAIADTVTYKGKLIGFCNTGCKTEFLTSPEKFIAELPKEESSKFE